MPPRGFSLKYLGSLIAIITATSVSHAQTDNSEERDLALTFGDSETVSIATGSQQPISRAPAVASVVTAEDIKAIGATNLDQVLESIPGLHVSRSSYRFNPIYSIRGIYTDNNPQVLVLVNGVPITQLFQGDRGIRSTLPVSNIARVEVIRGPGSAIYGADAFAGVINVITKQTGDIQGTEAGMRAGSFDSQDAWVLHGTNWNDFNIALSLEWQHQGNDGSRIIDVDQQTPFDSLFGTHASLAPGAADIRQRRLDAHLDVQRGDNWKFHLWNWRQDDQGVGPGVALALDPSGQGKANNYLADISYHNPTVSEHWDLTSRITYMDINTQSEQRLFPAGTALPIGSDGNINFLSPAGIVAFPDGLIGNPDIYEQHYRFSLDTFYTGLAEHRLRVGTGINFSKLHANETKNFGPGIIDGTVPVVNGALTDVTGTPYIFIEPKSRTNFFIFAQDEWALARDWNATLGLRYDNYSDFGDTLNPRAAIVWQTKFDLTTKLLYGRAFRAPSFSDLFVINNPVRLGNPNLNPETIDTFELAFDYQPTFDVNTKLNLFSYKIKHQISSVSNTGGASFTFENAGEQDGKGLEWETIWRLSGALELHGNYSYQKTSSNLSNNISGSAPKHHVYAALDWRFAGDWRLNTQANWIGSRERSSIDTRPPINDYTTVDITLRKPVGKTNWEAAVSVQNIFDQQPREPSPYTPPAAPIPNDFPLSGRNGYVEVRYHI